MEFTRPIRWTREANLITGHPLYRQDLAMLAVGQHVPRESAREAIKRDIDLKHPSEGQVSPEPQQSADDDSGKREDGTISAMRQCAIRGDVEGMRALLISTSALSVNAPLEPETRQTGIASRVE